jgi:hypothetical protein
MTYLGALTGDQADLAERLRALVADLAAHGIAVSITIRIDAEPAPTEEEHPPT